MTSDIDPSNSLRASDKERKNGTSAGTGRKSSWMLSLLPDRPAIGMTMFDELNGSMVSDTGVGSSPRPSVLNGTVSVRLACIGIWTYKFP